MRFLLYPDPEAWYARIAVWMKIQPVLHAATVSVARKTRTEGGWCGLLERRGEPLLALAQTPSIPVMMTTPHPVAAEAVAVLIDGWRQYGLDPCGVNGPVDWARAITTRIGRTVTDEMGLRLHLLKGTARCPHPPPGSARGWEAHEIAQAQAWEDAFSQEVEHGSPHTSKSREWVLDRLADYQVWDHDGPRSMARAVRPFHGGWSIAGVFTPRQHRGHGYAGAVVHALCHRLLDSGATYLALYTDLANPTSNRIYRDIGFVPVADQVRVRWRWDGP